MKRPFPSLPVRLSLLLMLGIWTSTVAQTTARREIRLTPGDAIHLYVYDSVFPSERGKFTANYHDTEMIIDGQGLINLGPLGRVQVAGLKPEEIAQVFQEKFKPFSKEPYVIVIPLIRISLKGGFAQPGMYRFNPNMSFWEMMKQVGGLQNLAAFEDMYIVRDRETIYRPFEEAFYHGQSLYELGFESGDELLAPRVNRLTFEAIMRYIQFGMSMLTFYFALLTYNTNK